MFIKQLSVFIENKEGRLDEVLNNLSEGGVNLLSASLADTTDYGVLRLIAAEPDKAKEFVERTGCDSLAVAIGNVHGVYSSEPKLAFDILEKVHKEVNVPLVLHGASGIGDEDIKTAISLGIAKINIHTELCQAAMEAVNANKDQPFLAMQREVRKAVKERAAYKINLFGDAGRADQ